MSVLPLHPATPGFGAWLALGAAILAALLTVAAPAAAERPQAGEPIEIGRSALDRPLLAHRVGDGTVKRALIGGIHGGYEWNTVELMSATLEHLNANPDLIPAALTLYVIPLMNPDGYAAGTDRTRGRMNGNGVDLNRNWDYEWRPDARHGRWPVSGGSAPFSEPESRAVRDFILNKDISAVVIYHSAFNAVFPGAGQDTSDTVALARHMARATGYRYMPAGIPGQIMSGGASDWLSAHGIDAIEIELTNHRDVEWTRNLAGVRAFLAWQLPE